MPRIHQLADTEAAAETGELFAKIRGKLGMVPNLYRVAGNQPAVLRALLGLNETLSAGDFDARTREAIALTVAGENTCDYCASAHSAIARNLKVEDAEINAQLSGKSRDPRLQAILTLAADVVRQRGLVGDDQLHAARSAGLTDANVAEVVANVVANIFTNYLNHVAQTEIDFPLRVARAA